MLRFLLNNERTLPILIHLITRSMHDEGAEQRTLCGLPSPRQAREAALRVRRTPAARRTTSGMISPADLAAAARKVVPA